MNVCVATECVAGFIGGDSISNVYAAGGQGSWRAEGQAYTFGAKRTHLTVQYDYDTVRTDLHTRVVWIEIPK